MHGQAIKMMQSFGLDKMAAYPYVRAAIIGHANKQSPQSCKLVKLYPFFCQGSGPFSPIRIRTGSGIEPDLFGIFFATS
jgi:hypothetical protein